jgi:hypothetical protein
MRFHRMNGNAHMSGQPLLLPLLLPLFCSYSPKINPKKLQNPQPSKQGNPQTTITTQSTTPKPQKNHTQNTKTLKNPLL